MNSIYDTFLRLVRLGIGRTERTELTEDVDWEALKNLADAQEMSAIILDGLNRLPHGSCTSYNMPKRLRLEWIGEVLQMEAIGNVQKNVANDLGNLFYSNGILTYVLKGAVIAECYPNPMHRQSADLDCFLLPAEGNFDAWKRGNDVVRAKGYEVYDGFYKNSSLQIPNLLVENHQFMTPFRGNKTLRRMERVLQEMIRADERKSEFEGCRLYRPPVMVSALFLIEHAYSHFLHEGLTWRMVLDWQMFSSKNKDEICWTDFEALIDEFELRKFYDSFCRLGVYLVGDITADDLQPEDRMMQADIWAPLDLHEQLEGVKAKFQLAGNFWRARWKYKYFTNTNWVRALMEWVLGAAFVRHPNLN